MPTRPESLRDAPAARGILSSPQPDGWLDTQRILPSEALSGHVHHYWCLRWDLRSPYMAEALPHTSVIIMHTATRRQRTEVLGVSTRRIRRTLSGAGFSFGVTFRAATFQPVLRRPMRTITDRRLPASQVLGDGVRRWTRSLAVAGDLAVQVALTEAFLAPLLSPLDERPLLMRDVVERIATDRAMLRVHDVAAACDLDRRALQRAFRTHVGVSPKWVLQRYRLIDAAVQLAQRPRPALADLSYQLGYSDQAHFCRDFKRITGQSPLAFARAGGPGG